MAANGERPVKKIEGAGKGAHRRAGGRKIIYEAIELLHSENGYPIYALCKAAGISRSACYKSRRMETTERERENAAITKAMLKIHEKTGKIYGYRRMTMNINAELGKQYNRKRIRRLMQKAGIKSAIRLKKKTYTKTAQPVTAENILKRNFTASEPAQKWLTDITEFRLADGSKAYLCAILDLCCRSITAYELGVSNNNQLVFKTLDAALSKTRHTSGLILHSDRGVQYTSRGFRAKLDAAGIIQSMSRPGKCIDNGPMEGFWGIIKSEMFYLGKFNKFQELKEAIDRYMRFYHTERRQEKLNCLTPLAYRRQILKR